MNDFRQEETILIVDDEPANIKALVAALGDRYRVLAATSGEQALDIIFERSGELDLILLDVLMPGLTGYDVNARVRSYPETADIPIIFITARTGPDEEAMGLDMGAADYIGKPFHPITVRARVKTQIDLKKHKEYLDELVAARTQEVLTAREDIVLRLAKAAETRDHETGKHIIRLSKLCEMLARANGMRRDQARTLATASLMHDIGKIGIPDNILLKPGRHTDEERAIMQTHTTLGGNILANGDNDLLVMAREIALTHHEHWDGTGYPNGLAGVEIPLEGRITSVCDVFDALTSVRPYKQAWDMEEAAEFLRENSGSMFEPKQVALFLENLEKVQAILAEYRDEEERQLLKS